MRDTASRRFNTVSVMQTPRSAPGDLAAIHIRHQIQAGDLGLIARAHGLIYSRECGFDETFEAYVATPLAECVIRRSPSDRLWIAERAGRFFGCIAIVEASPSQVQLRWYLVDPAARGIGLGKRLLQLAVEFCRERRYETCILWTVAQLTGAANLYRWAGFRKIQEKPGVMWGVQVVEEKYELRITS